MGLEGDDEAGEGVYHLVVELVVDNEVRAEEDEVAAVVVDDHKELVAV